MTPVLARNWEITKRVFAKNLHQIKHWTIICGDYSTAPDVQATWFIDPPYQGESGLGYRYSSKCLDYYQLAQWALRRKGEIIFCEGRDADYLPFQPLVDLKGVAGKVSQEVIFYQSQKKSPVQLSLL